MICVYSLLARSQNSLKSAFHDSLIIAAKLQKEIEIGENKKLNFPKGCAAKFQLCGSLCLLCATLCNLFCYTENHREDTENHRGFFDVLLIFPRCPTLARVYNPCLVHKFNEGAVSKVFLNTDDTDNTDSHGFLYCL